MLLSELKSQFNAMPAHDRLLAIFGPILAIIATFYAMQGLKEHEYAMEQGYVHVATFYQSLPDSVLKKKCQGRDFIVIDTVFKKDEYYLYCEEE